MAEEKKKKSHTGRNTAIAAVILAALLGGGHFGLGIGRDGGPMAIGQSTGQPAQQSQAQTEAAADGVLEITVRENTVLYEGQELSLEALEEALLRDYVSGETAVTLTDDHAIKETFDAVSALLAKLDIAVQP